MPSSFTKEGDAHEQNGNYVVPVIIGVALFVDPLLLVIFAALSYIDNHNKKK